MRQRKKPVNKIGDLFYIDDNTDVDMINACKLYMSVKASTDGGYMLINLSDLRASEIRLLPQVGIADSEEELFDRIEKFGMKKAKYRFGIKLHTVKEKK